MLRRKPAGLPLPRAADGWIVLACDVGNWLRPEAVTSAERLFKQTLGWTAPKLRAHQHPVGEQSETDTTKSAAKRQAA
ncbi:hypothetical protein [Streptomyces sp. NPDC046751]|uniref:hypothetical protein n=1 Tax=unclassified Streptomyces TaxID=2593676 RepID=UPI00340CE9A8